jgi:ribosome-binding factor A
MNQILLNILAAVTTCIILPLISFLGIKLSQWLSTKIKDEKAAALFKNATEIVTNAVRVTFQTYVESLKNSGSFGKDEQLIALNKAKQIITSELTEDLKTFIVQNYGDLQTWISNQIEATIYKLKN